ncbi:hypothetical protein [Nocardia gipuzkoensis]
MRKLLMVVIAAALSSAAVALGSGSVNAEVVQPVRHDEIRTASQNCDIMYKKLLDVCDEKYSNIDARKRCYDSARADYRKCLASR